MTLLDKKFEDFKSEFGIHFEGTTELDFVHCFLEEFQNEILEEVKKKLPEYRTACFEFMSRVKLKEDFLKKAEKKLFSLSE